MNESYSEKIGRLLKTAGKMLAQAFPKTAVQVDITCRNGQDWYAISLWDERGDRRMVESGHPAALVGAAMDKVEKGEPAKAEVFSPAEYLRDELEARGWTREAFAHIAVLPLDTVDELLRGERRIGWTLAEKLGAAFGTSAEVWMNLQRAADKSA